MMLVTCVAAAAYSSNGVCSRNITLYVMGGGKMILSHHGMNAIKRSGDEGFVTVGGIKYPYKKIGRLYWTTASLRNLTEHAIMPSSGVADDGLLYQYYYVYREIIPLLHSGWRIPTHTDFFYLYYDASSNSNDYIAVEKGGNNSTGFNLKLIGYRSQSGSFDFVNQRDVVWSSTTRQYGTRAKFCGRFVLDDNFTIDNVSYGLEDELQTSAMEVRICKDI